MPKFLIFKNKYIKVSSLLSAAIFLVSFGVVYFHLRDVGYLLIIHFTKLGGIDFLGTRFDVLSILFTGLFIVFLNLLLAGFFYQRIRFFSHLLSFFNVFLSVLILIAVAVIISVN